MRSIWIVLITLLVTILPYLVSLLDFIILIPVHVCFLTLLSFSCSTINHNHVHVKTFKSKVRNRLFDILLTLAIGNTSKTVIVPHIYNHHHHKPSEKDWVSVDLAGDSRGIFRLVRYTILAVISMYKNRMEPSSPNLPQKKKIEQVQELAALIIFMAILGYMDFGTLIFFVLLPKILAMLMLVAINLLQHDRCTHDSEYEHARNFTGKLGNWFCFNNGYHTIHHLKPTLHWSLLPAEHEKQIARFVPPSLNEKSILGFLFKRYIFEIPSL